MGIAEKLRQLREARGWSMGQLALKAGVSKSLVSKLESGEGGHPRADSLALIAKALGVTTADLLAEKGTDESGTYVSAPVVPTGDTMQSVIASVTDLQETLENLVAAMAREVTMVPHLGRVPAGTPLPPIEAATIHTPIPSRLLAGIIRPATVTVSGDSMAPTLLDGADLVLETDPGQQITDGAIYAVQYDGQTCVKRVFRSDEQLTLASDNPAFRPLVVREGQVILIGRVRGIVQIQMVP